MPSNQTKARKGALEALNMALRQTFTSGLSLFERKFNVKRKVKVTTVSTTTNNSGKAHHESLAKNSLAESNHSIKTLLSSRKSGKKDTLISPQRVYSQIGRAHV